MIESINIVNIQHIYDRTKNQFYHFSYFMLIALAASVHQIPIYVMAESREDLNALNNILDNYDLLPLKILQENNASSQSTSLNFSVETWKMDYQNILQALIPLDTDETFRTQLYFLLYYTMNDDLGYSLRLLSCEIEYFFFNVDSSNQSLVEKSIKFINALQADESMPGYELILSLLRKSLKKIEILKNASFAEYENLSLENFFKLFLSQFQNELSIEFFPLFSLITGAFVEEFTRQFENREIKELQNFEFDLGKVSYKNKHAINLLQEKGLIDQTISAMKSFDYVERYFAPFIPEKLDYSQSKKNVLTEVEFSLFPKRIYIAKSVGKIKIPNIIFISVSHENTEQDLLRIIYRIADVLENQPKKNIILIDETLSVNLCAIVLSLMWYPVPKIRSLMSLVLERILKFFPEMTNQKIINILKISYKLSKGISTLFMHYEIGKLFYNELTILTEKYQENHWNWLLVVASIPFELAMKQVCLIISSKVNPAFGGFQKLYDDFFKRRLKSYFESLCHSMREDPQLYNNLKYKILAHYFFAYYDNKISDLKNLTADIVSTHGTKSYQRLLFAKFTWFSPYLFQIARHILIKDSLKDPYVVDEGLKYLGLAFFIGGHVIRRKIMDWIQKNSAIFTSEKSVIVLDHIERVNSLYMHRIELYNQSKRSNHRDIRLPPRTYFLAAQPRQIISSLQKQQNEIEKRSEERKYINQLFTL